MLPDHFVQKCLTKLAKPCLCLHMFEKCLIQWEDLDVILTSGSHLYADVLAQRGYGSNQLISVEHMPKSLTIFGCEVRIDYPSVVHEHK